MEVKLIFRNFRKIFNLNYDNSNYVRAFQRLKIVIKSLIGESFELYWKDKDNDFIFFDSHDEFGLALSLNKDYIEIYVCHENNDKLEQQCSKCQEKFNYVYQCLNCLDVVLCKNCFESHQESITHFAILEKRACLQVHPFLYRELKMLVDEELCDDSIYNIESYFQKLLGNLGISFEDQRSDTKETPINSPGLTNDTFTMQPLNTVEDQCATRNVDNALRFLESMGFTNENSWLKKKLVEFNGDILKTVDWINRKTGNNFTNKFQS